MCLDPTWTRSCPDQVGILLLPKHADPSLRLPLINEKYLMTGITRAGALDGECYYSNSFVYSD